MPEQYSWTSVFPINLLANIDRASLSPCAYVLVRWTASCTIGNRHSTHNQQIREDNRSGCSGGVPSILARLTVSWCVVNPSHVWSDGWLCQLPNRTIAHGQGVAERGLVRLRRSAHTTSSQALARSSQSPSGQPCQTTFGFSTQI